MFLEPHPVGGDPDAYSKGESFYLFQFNKMRELTGKMLEQLAFRELR
jgi:hypothetical protein